MRTSSSSEFCGLLEVTGGFSEWSGRRKRRKILAGSVSTTGAASRLANRPASSIDKEISRSDVPQKNQRRGVRRHQKAGRQGKVYVVCDPARGFSDSSEPAERTGRYRRRNTCCGPVFDRGWRPGGALRELLAVARPHNGRPQWRRLSGAGSPDTARGLRSSK